MHILVGNNFKENYLNIIERFFFFIIVYHNLPGLAKGRLELNLDFSGAVSSSSFTFKHY